MKARKQVRLDEQSQEDARRIAERYNLGSVSAAIRFALREVARNVAAGVAASGQTGELPQQNAEK